LSSGAPWPKQATSKSSSASLRNDAAHCARPSLNSPNGPLGGLNSFYLLVDEPEVYGLPRDPQLPSRNLPRSGALSAASGAVLGLLALVGLRKRRMDEIGRGGAIN